MSDLAISLRGIGKSYRRFTTRFWQGASLLGCPVPARSFDVFWALADISFDVRRGERVGLIGRNGAGKTTLLRMVAGQVSPSCGTVRVEGQVQALMELGTGFHPEFSAMQNMRTALALSGLEAGEIGAKIEEIVDFTELDGFLDRPLREYSAGMYARLAFAVATSVKPGVLIVDEILGAGDAYFIGKCTQRVRELAEGGTTVLFVSHDLGSVQMLCERAIWLHHGAMRADGSSLAVAKSYQAHIREEEEKRLRARAMSLSSRQSRAIGAAGTEQAASLYRLIGAGGAAPILPCHVREIRFGAGDRTIAAIAVGASDTEGEARLLVEPAQLNWGKAQTFAAVRCRVYGDYGGRYCHAPFVMEWPPDITTDRWLELVIAPSPSGPIDIDAFDAAEQRYRTLARVPIDAAQEWRTIRAALIQKTQQPTATSPGSGTMQEPPGAAAAAAENEAEPPHAVTVGRGERYGSGEIVIVDFAFYDAAGIRRHTLVTGEKATAVLVYQAYRPVVDPVAVIAVYRADSVCAMQLISRRDAVEFGEVSGNGELIVELDPLLLGPGDYVISLALFKDLDLRLAVEPPGYDVHDRAYLLRVLPPEGINCTIGTVNQRACWRVARTGGAQPALRQRQAAARIPA
jgi:lipopolysaccharide transport system ATP-binding protein